MFGTLCEEIEVNVPASEAWDLYGTLEVAKVVVDELPHILNKFEVVEGDGSAGTILKLTFPPGTPIFTTYKEKFTKVDNEKRVKEAEVIEGGYLDLGFNLFRVRFEIIDKCENSCITRTTIEYDVKEENAANVAFVSIQPHVTIMNAAANYLIKNHKN